MPKKGPPTKPPKPQKHTLVALAETGHVLGQSVNVVHRRAPVAPIVDVPGYFAHYGAGRYWGHSYWCRQEKKARHHATFTMAVKGAELKVFLP